MSHFLDRLTHFTLPKEEFADGHGKTTGEDRTWEDAYRSRWAHDKIVRSTHGVNCTGSCSWKIYVKGGIVTWETQQTDYPRTHWYSRRFASDSTMEAHASTGFLLERASRQLLSRRPRTIGYFTRLAL